MSANKKNILGYIWSFKESVAENNTISVKFLSGVSNTYPATYQNKRDFQCYEVCEGDYSTIFIDPGAYALAAQSELNRMLKDRKYHREMYTERKHWFKSNLITEAIYLATYAFIGAKVCFIRESWDTDSTEIETLFKFLKSNKIYVSGYNVRAVLEDITQGLSSAYQHHLHSALS